MEQRLTCPYGNKRKLFTRIAERPFDDNRWLLAYVAPDYSATERRTLMRRERATVNLDLVATGWGCVVCHLPVHSRRNLTCAAHRGRR